MQYKVRLFNKTGYMRYPVSLLWTTAKTYYEENSKNANLWDWGDPNIDYLDIEKVFAQILVDKPTVVGFSLYLWNEAFTLILSKKIKEVLPNTYIVYGGPQHDVKFNNDYFKTHPYVDLVTPSDAYGEVSLYDILENIVTNNGKLKGNEIPYAYWPDDQLNVHFNSLAPKKKDFKWPKNAFRAQEKHISPVIRKAKESTVGLVWVPMETSRGCPYKCSFCDWGGGTYTKTVKKDFSTTMDEILWTGQNQIDGIYFCDANFGIFNIDIEFIKQCIKVNKKYGYPKLVHIQPTKAKIDNLYEIYLLLSNANMLSHYQISIQDLNDDVKKNVDRIDFSFEDQVQMFKKLQANKYLPIWIEGILGLPGSSIETIKDSIHRINLEKLPFPISYNWVLLPAAPAYDPEYREKFKIKTVKGKTSTGMGSCAPLKEKTNRSIDPGVNKAVADEFDTMSEYVVETMSYDSKQWVDMNMLQIFTASTQQAEILDLISQYLWQEHKINYGEFFDKTINTMLYDDQIDSDLRQQFSKLKIAYDDWVSGDSPDLYCDFKEEFSFAIAPTIYYIFVILTNIDKFFEGIIYVIDKFVPVDDKIIDLCHFSRQRLIDITYRPGRTFSTQYDWPKYINKGVLEHTQKTYQLDDTQILTGGTWFDIDWAQYEGSLNYYSHYIYRVCYDFRSKKTSTKMIEQPSTIE